MNFEKLVLRIADVNYFDDISKIKDFTFNILLDEKSYEKFLFCDIQYKTLIDDDDDDDELFQWYG